MSIFPAVTPLASIEPRLSGDPSRWFAVYTTPNHEKRVTAHFGLRGIESYLPLYRAKRRWKNGCTVTLELPLFPGYVFVHIAPGERVRVLEVPSVLWIVGNGREPLPLPDVDIESLRAGLGARGAQPHPYLTQGHRARIRCGPLLGWEGVVLWTKGESRNLRVVLSLDAIMKSVAVEVGADELELLGAAA
jgi:transcription antitermination factor NusG